MRSIPDGWQGTRMDNSLSSFKHLLKSVLRSVLKFYSNDLKKLSAS